LTKPVRTIPERTSYASNVRFGLTLPLLLVLVLLASPRSQASDLALVGGTIYLSPSEPPIERGTVVVHGGHILSVGPIAEIKVPQGATAIDCKGLVVTAGFWNSHVHILLPGLLHAEKLSSDQIASQLQQMLTSWGFTTVFDIASVLRNTCLLYTSASFVNFASPVSCSMWKWKRCPICDPSRRPRKPARHSKKTRASRPVSYTHLDVYKRQDNAPWRRRGRGWSGRFRRRQVAGEWRRSKSG